MPSSAMRASAPLPAPADGASMPDSLAAKLREYAGHPATERWARIEPQIMKVAADFLAERSCREAEQAAAQQRDALTALQKAAQDVSRKLATLDQAALRQLYRVDGNAKELATGSGSWRSLDDLAAEAENAKLDALQIRFGNALAAARSMEPATPGDAPTADDLNAYRAKLTAMLDGLTECAGAAARRAGQDVRPGPQGGKADLSTPARAFAALYAELSGKKCTASVGGSPQGFTSGGGRFVEACVTELIDPTATVSRIKRALGRNPAS